jgi:hypothetical protein
MQRSIVKEKKNGQRGKRMTAARKEAEYETRKDDRQKERRMEEEI